MVKKLGLIVNPIAGMGGRVGLRGSDGQEILNRAVELGAVRESPKRAVAALTNLTRIRSNIELVTYPHEMGEEEARECGFDPVVIGSIERGHTTAGHTQNAAREMLKAKMDLLLFAGGDGTARDIYEIVGTRMPALGIPAGVKIHSAVYATSPKNAGHLAARYLGGSSSGVSLCEAEVMDIDEESFRKNRLMARLYGYLKIPYEKGMVQDAKTGSGPGEEAAMVAIAWDIINSMNDDELYIVGPGTKTRAIMDRLGLKNTLLGVDAVSNKRLVGLDLNEAQLLKMIEGRKARIVIGVIGRQGYIFGRGNQQISPKIINQAGKENIKVVATKSKVFSLRGAPLLVDTGDDEVNEMLTGYIQVTSGFGETIVLKVES